MEQFLAARKKTAAKNAKKIKKNTPEFGAFCNRKLDELFEKVSQQFLRKMFTKPCTYYQKNRTIVSANKQHLIESARFNIDKVLTENSEIHLDNKLCDRLAYALSDIVEELLHSTYKNDKI